MRSSLDANYGPQPIAMRQYLFASLNRFDRFHSPTSLYPGASPEAVACTSCFHRRHESRIPPPQTLFIDATASGHDRVGQLKGAQMHILPRVFEPHAALQRRRLIFFNYRLPNFFKLLQCNCYVHGLIETLLQSNRVFKRELRA